MLMFNILIMLMILPVIITLYLVRLEIRWVCTLSICRRTFYLFCGLRIFFSFFFRFLFNSGGLVLPSIGPKFNCLLFRIFHTVPFSAKSRIKPPPLAWYPTCYPLDYRVQYLQSYGAAIVYYYVFKHYLKLK